MVALVYACTTLAFFKLLLNFSSLSLGFQHWFGVSDPFGFLQSFSAMFGFLTPPFGFPPFCLSSFLRFLFPSPLPPLMVATTPHLFFSSLVVFPYSFCFSRLPFDGSHIVLFTHFFVWFSTPCFFGALFVFSRLIFALSASLFASSSCVFLAIPLCFSALLVLLPF